MEQEHLIRRDLPLERGRLLRFSFTVSFELPLDEDLTGDDTPATLDELENWLGDTYCTSESIYRALAGNHNRNVVEHVVTLEDRYEGADEGPVRFEHPWEQQSRERGETWGSRVWLEYVPMAGAPPFGPGSNPPVTASKAGASELREIAETVAAGPLSGVDEDAVRERARRALSEHPSAAEVMEREG